jgi:hypothetical protein
MTARSKTVNLMLQLDVGWMHISMSGSPSFNLRIHLYCTVHVYCMYSRVDFTCDVTRLPKKRTWLIGGVCGCFAMVSCLDNASGNAIAGLSPCKEARSGRRAKNQ